MPLAEKHKATLIYLMSKLNEVHHYQFQDIESLDNTLNVWLLNPKTNESTNESAKHFKHWYCANQLASIPIEPTEFIYAIAKFSYLVNTKQTTKSINDFLSLAALQTYLCDAKFEYSIRINKKLNKLKAKVGSLISYKNNKVSVIRLLSVEAVMFYSIGSAWCTRKKHHAEKYLNAGRLYVYLCSDGCKFLAFLPNQLFNLDNVLLGLNLLGGIQFKDEQNYSSDIYMMFNYLPEITPQDIEKIGLDFIALEDIADARQRETELFQIPYFDNLRKVLDSKFTLKYCLS